MKRFRLVLALLFVCIVVSQAVSQPFDAPAAPSCAGVEAPTCSGVVQAASCSGRRKVVFAGAQCRAERRHERQAARRSCGG